MLSEKYEAVIGLEVHAQLKTKTKLFTPSLNDFGNDPNTQTDPIVLGMPGVLPVLNREAVTLALRVGLAVGSTVNNRSRFARKHYFYPDLPKGYQISQFDEPILSGGTLTVNLAGKEKTIRLNRIHLEEDAGKSIHSESFIREGCSYVDLNRAGVPLIEIVSEPDLRGSEEAGAYLKMLRAILRYVGASDADMEKGHFRCDANVSIRPRGQEKFGTRVEIKNVNSFRNVMRAIEYELDRHEAVLADGGTLVQETRLWDPGQNVTRSMRSKETSPDYRYMPEPDLLPVEIAPALIASIKATMPELPFARRARFIETFGLHFDDANLLTEEKPLADYFETVVAAGADGRKASNWVLSELLRLLNAEGGTIESCKIAPAQLGRMIKLIDDGIISGKIAKTLIEEMFATGKDPDALVKEKGLEQISDTGAVEKVIEEVMAANPDKVAEYRSGKDKLFGFFVGQVMKASGGKASPGVVNDLLKQKLAG